MLRKTVLKLVQSDQAIDNSVSEIASILCAKNGIATPATLHRNSYFVDIKLLPNFLLISGKDNSGKWCVLQNDLACRC